jgi:glycosyltransferase involved in cell wall biosynthesis
MWSGIGNEAHMHKVGLILSTRGSWQGGKNYFKNLLACYRKYPDPEIKLAVFSLDPEDFSSYECDAIEVHAYPEVNRRSAGGFVRRIARRALGYDPVRVRILSKERVDLLSHTGENGQQKIRTLYWQPDFQHKALPQYFSPQECENRDAKVAETARWGNILLSSHAAEADFRRYYPELAHVHAHVLHFSSAAVLDCPAMKREELALQYPVVEPYFFLPNQFWQHKNHGVVVEALERLPTGIRVLCTGSMDDYRDKDYIPGLLEKVKTAGLEKRFICLGTVPYRVLVSLMDHSIAVIQPSLFEGWSTTVEESKAMNKRIVLSKIDVHVEQAPERGVYFSPQSADELACCLQRVFDEYDPAVEQAYGAQRAQNRIRIERDWILEYPRIVKAVLGQ